MKKEKKVNHRHVEVCNHVHELMTWLFLITQLNAINVLVAIESQTFFLTLKMQI